MLSITKSISQLESLVEKLSSYQKLSEKIAFLMSLEEVSDFFREFPLVNEQIRQLSPEDRFLGCCLVAIGQGPITFQWFKDDKETKENFQKFMSQIKEIHQFYEGIGGLIGYYLTLLKLINPSDDKRTLESYSRPAGIDVTEENSLSRHLTIKGLENLPKMAEIYPIGGAGDRLMLKDETQGILLPAACLLFCGRSLLDGLIRDLQAREYLFYKLWGKQLTTPIAMMTSHEKNNHQHILQICEKNRWFGRSKDQFFFMIQPLTPLVTKEGEWCFSAPFKLVLKPGGHGVIWRLADEVGMYDWFREKKRHKAIVRQINNPIAGTDYGLLTLAGAGFEKTRSFGFASCERLLKASEGMDVLKEVKINDGFEYCITNIEYTEFAKKEISDSPGASGSPYSVFPANTNILFADLEAVKQKSKSHPIPGMLINMKNKAQILTIEGHLEEKTVGRLESTMQNIADYMVNQFSKPLSKNLQNDLQTFVTYNQRKKTISVTKKAFQLGESIEETPEGCFYHLLENHYDLLTNYCNFDVPMMNPCQEYMESGPSFIFLFHPSLGPLYSIISQKLRNGKIALRSELQLEVAEVDIDHLEIEGSLIIEADSVMGNFSKDFLRYSEDNAKCSLQHVKVKNAGIDFQTKQCFWKNQINRKEFLKIRLLGNAEFFAENVSFLGSHHIEVPSGHRMVAYQEGDSLKFRLEKISGPSWFWKYSIGDDKRIILQKEPK